MQSTNAQLIAAITDGEIHRYSEVVQRFDIAVRATVSATVSDPAAIEDLVQETFYRAFKELGNLTEPDRLQSWLKTIARNCIADHYRSSSRRAIREFDRGLQTLNHQTERTIDSNRGWIWDEVEKLKSAHKEILVLRYQCSSSYEEIASQLSVPESTVRGRIFEARKALKQRLQEKKLFP